MEIDDELRWLIALISDTGMRLAEATGLLIEDIKLNTEVPYVSVRSHSWRPLKTKGSKRDIPLDRKAMCQPKELRKCRKANLHFQDIMHQPLLIRILPVHHLING